MPKTKTKKVLKSGKDGISVKRHFVVRDLATKMLLIIDESNISTNKKARLDVGLEITYHTAQRDRGRGVIVLIGSEEECEALVVSLECESLLEEFGNNTETMKTSNGSSTTIEKKCEENSHHNVVEELAKRKDDMIDIENYDHVQIMKEKNVNVCDSMLQKNKNDNKTNKENNAGTNGMIKKKNDGSDRNIEEETDDINKNSFSNENSFEYIDSTTSDSIIQAVTGSSHTNWLDEASKTATDKESLHHEELCMKRSNTSSENSSVNKRLKGDDDDSCSSAQITALKEENKKLKEEIEYMKIHYVPRPNPETIDYFATVVSIYTAGISHIHYKKMLKEMIDTLSLNEEELERCVDDKSIRKTCRNVLRKVFKSELMDSTVPYSRILSNETVMAAIREFGRIKHPLESMKFTDGDLNNAIGSDFYKRDSANNMNKENS